VQIKNTAKSISRLNYADLFIPEKNAKNRNRCMKTLFKNPPTTKEQYQLKSWWNNQVI
jgi:hypothetical protein